VIVIGFVVFAVAVAAAIVFIAQNQTAMVEVHGLGYTWNVHLYWVMVAGLVIAGVGLMGLAMMRSGAAHTARIRTERRGLERENARLSDIASERPVAPAVVSAPPAAPVMVDRNADYDTATEVDTAPRGRHLFGHRTRQA
jgi:hypothetical protein